MLRWHDIERFYRGFKDALLVSYNFNSWCIATHAERRTIHVFDIQCKGENYVNNHVPMMLNVASICIGFGSLKLIV